MRKLASLLPAILLSLTGIALAASPPDGRVVKRTDTSVCASDQTSGVVPNGQTKVADLNVTGTELTSQPVSGPPPCPALRSCGADTCQSSQTCHPVGTTQTVNTGFNSCVKSNGTVVTCAPGKTIQYSQRSCTQCPCCPAHTCVCPINCGVEISAVFCL